jgi:hypothetical protein
VYSRQSAGATSARRRLLRFESRAIMRAPFTMADLEKLALQRDRGYLLRLILLLAVGLGAAAFMYAWLTGSTVTGCVAGALGADTKTRGSTHPPR